MYFLKGFEKIVCKDDLRPSLGIVLFEEKCAIATDGFKLVKVNLKLYGLTNKDIENLEGFTLDLEILNELKLKRNQSLLFKKGKIEVISRNRLKPLKVLELSTCRELNLKFPNYDLAMGKKEEAVSHISFSSSSLQEVEYVYDSLPSTEQNKRELLNFVFTGLNSGIRVQNFDGSFEALVKPRKSAGYKDLSKQ